MNSGSTMRHAFLAAFAACALLLPQTAEAALARGLGTLAAGQLSFEGLDLTDDEKPAAKSKSKSKSRAKAKSKPKAVKRADPPSSPIAAPAAPVEQPSAPSSSGFAAPAADGAVDLPGLDLSSESATAAPKPPEPPKKEKPAPLMTFDAMDVSGKSAERQRLDAAIKQFNDDNYELASLAFQEVIADPKMAELHDESQYMLAKALYRMGLYHSALNNFKVLLAKGPNTKFFKTCLEWLFYIAHKTVNEQVVLEEVAKHANHEFPERFRAEFRYLLARYHFARGKALSDAEQPEESTKAFEEAKRLVLMIPRDDPFYAKVKYVEGAISFKSGDFTQALEAFKEVVRTNNPRTNPQANLDLRELGFMQLARTHYGHKQNRYAIFYYDKITRGSEQWLEALFEASWAHFRVGEYERALGNLITLSSPFFKDEYFPEALILKAVIYYENCRYREARAILEEFEQTYMPVHNELEKILATNADAQTYWDIMAELQRRNRNSGGRGGSLLLERILKLALTDKDLKAVNESILEVEREMDSMIERRDLFRYSELAKGLNEGLKAERATMMAKAGILAKAKLESELVQLKDLLGQALRIKFETSAKEKDFLEAQLQQGGKKEVVRQYSHSVAVGDQEVYWPYEGEYWRDELGTYEYTLTKGCKAQ